MVFFVFVCRNHVSFFGKIKPFLVMPYLFTVDVSVLVSTIFNIVKAVEELIPMVLSVLFQKVQLSVIYFLYTLSPASFGKYNLL